MEIYHFSAQACCDRGMWRQGDKGMTCHSPDPGKLCDAPSFDASRWTIWLPFLSLVCCLLLGRSALALPGQIR